MRSAWFPSAMKAGSLAPKSWTMAVGKNQTRMQVMVIDIVMKRKAFRITCRNPSAFPFPTCMAPSDWSVWQVPETKRL